MVKKVGIIGLGNMGMAVARALVESGFPPAAVLSFEIKQELAKLARDNLQLHLTADLPELARESSYIILAVKPQDAKSALQVMAPMMDDSKVLISIMAGVTSSNIMDMLGRPAKVVRVMPNICVAIAQGALGIAPSRLLTAEESSAVMELLKPLGTVIEVTEDQMDAVTALSGSGPAFVLAFLEALIDGGVKMGLARDKSYKLALQTMKGTISLLEKEGVHPTLMKERVTSPGGTTIAGLATLEEKGFKGTIIRCLEAAQVRAKELSK